MSKPARDELTIEELDPTKPLYSRVKRLVLSKIEAGAWPVNHRVPSESRLVEELGVCRMTVHRALKELTEEQVLRRVPGVGSFVAPGKGHAAHLRIEDIGEQIRRRGHTHSCEVKVLREEPAGGEAAELFGVAPDDALFHSTIVHHENEDPLMVEDKLVLPELAPAYLEQDFSQRSTGDYLRSVIVATDAEQYVEACEPTEKVRGILRLRRGPCLSLVRRIWALDRVAVASRRIYPGSPFRLGGRLRKSSSP